MNKKIFLILISVLSSNLICMQKPEEKNRQLIQNLSILKDSLNTLQCKLQNLNHKLDYLKINITIQSQISEFKQFIQLFISAIKIGDLEETNKLLAKITQIEIFQILKNQTILGQPILHWAVSKTLSTKDPSFLLILKSICSRIDDVGLLELKAIQYKNMDLPQFIKSLGLDETEESFKEVKSLLKI